MINLAVLVDPEWAMEVLRLAEWALEHQEESADCDCGQPYDVDDWTCHDPFQGKLKSEVFESLRQVTAEFNKVQGLHRNDYMAPENRDDPPSTVKSRDQTPDPHACDHHFLPRPEDLDYACLQCGLVIDSEGLWKQYWNRKYGEKKAKVEGASPRTPTNSDGIHGKVPNSGSEPERDRKSCPKCGGESLTIMEHHWLTSYKCSSCGASFPGP